jgi:alpha-beta hydrolase superfamily lysophospholipase
VLPLYFGTSRRPLYGVFHDAAAGKQHGAGVVMCQGMGNEAMRGQRAFVRLARSVAEAGLPALRYDHPGSGDSAGEQDDVDLDELIEGVELAGEELRALAGIERLLLVGHRLGAWLSLEAAPRLDARAIVAWDPVLDGRGYVELLRAESDAASSTETSIWVHGFPWSLALLDELVARVTTSPLTSACAPVLTLEPEPRPTYAGAVTMPRAGGRLERLTIPAAREPGHTLREGGLLLPGDEVRQAAAFLARSV